MKKEVNKNKTIKNTILFIIILSAKNNVIKLEGSKFNMGTKIIGI